ncbi:MAG: spore cortex biosynthesis protein YabQ [Oscillospiraceae bacterium]|nr:spore cortex biosynthesis protein YabQ [Oscillospiraceae bacterium]
MEMSMTAQGIVFLFSCVVGAFLGVFYDVFRIIRIAFNSKWVSVFFQDFIFCIFSAVSIILLVYYTNSGIVRWFSLFGCFLCFVLYHLTIGRFIIFVSKKIIDFIKMILRFIKKITITPMKIAILFIIKQLKYLIQFIFRQSVKTKNNMYYKSEKRKISHDASYGFGLYRLYKSKKTPIYISKGMKNMDSIKFKNHEKKSTEQKNTRLKSNKNLNYR